jgi:hypothetical protein
MQRIREAVRIYTQGQKTKLLRPVMKLVGVVFLAGVFCTLLTPTARAGNAVLAWDAATGATGYRLHYGTTSGAYSESIDVANTTSYIVNNLVDGQTYYFAAVSYDFSGKESGYSNEVSQTISASTQYNLSVITNGTGTGTVSGAGINCGSVCSDSYAPGTLVTLTATPASGSTFAGWSGGGCTGTGTCAVTMKAATSVTATFNSNTTTKYTITATASGNGMISALNNTNFGTATSGTSTITAVEVAKGANQSFSIAPSVGYQVAGVVVDGVPVGAVTSYTFSNVTANHTLSATFAATSTSAYWNEVTTAKTAAQNGTPKYMQWSPLVADATGTVTKLHISVKSFGSPTQIRLALYNASGKKLTEGAATVYGAGYAELAVPAALVTKGSTYYIAAQAASNQLYQFDCGSTSGGFEGSNTFSNGFPDKLPRKWKTKLLTTGMYIQ